MNHVATAMAVVAVAGGGGVEEGVEAAVGVAAIPLGMVAVRAEVMDSVRSGQEADEEEVEAARAEIFDRRVLRL